MVQAVGAVVAALAQELDRLQAVGDLDRAGRLQCRGEVAEQRKPGHPGAVAVAVVGPPARLHRMRVGGVQGRFDQWMTTVDAGIEQADRGCVRTRCGIAGPLQQVVEPLRLLFGRHGIEEVGGLFGPAQFGDAVQGQHGAFELGRGALDQQYGAFGELDLTLGKGEAKRFCEALEVADGLRPFAADRQPDLPPDDGQLVLGKGRVGVGPKLPEGGGADTLDGVDQCPVVTGLGAGQVVLNQTFEVLQLAVRHEDGGDRLGPRTPDVQQLDPEALPGQTLEGEVDVWEALEGDGQAESGLQSHLLLLGPSLGCDGLNGSKLREKSGAMGRTIALGDLRSQDGNARGLEGLRGGRVGQDQVGAFIARLVRHFPVRIPGVSDRPGDSPWSAARR